jgi:hypothetical protein
MATLNSRPLMRQKVNVHSTLLEHYKKNMAHDLRNVIHKSLLNFEDYGLSFEHQGRNFEIYGFTENSHVILREIVNEESFYWECTQAFVQMKLGRINYRYVKVAGKPITIPMDYEIAQLLLPPVRATRKKAQEEEEDLPKDELETVTYTDDDYTEENED